MAEKAVERTGVEVAGGKYERWASPKSHISVYVKDPELFLEFKYLVRNVWGRSVGAVIEELVRERVRTWKARGNLFSVADLRKEYLRLDQEWKSFRKRVTHISVWKE